MDGGGGMSANGTIIIAWANGEDTFCIAKVGHLLDLEDKCSAGVAAIMRRLEDGSWRLNDVRETIRLGLIGGGMAPEQAMVTVKRHVDDQPLARSVLLAYEVLAAAMVGVPGDGVGKKPEAETDTRSSARTDVSAAPPSSGSAPPSNGLPATPSSAPSGSSQPPSTATTPPMETILRPIP